MRGFKGIWAAALLAAPALAGTGDITLTDASGLQWFINTDITFNTSSSASGAASEASYTNVVSATTSMGGTSMTTLTDAFDGYNTLVVNGTIYNQNGAATTECNGRVVALNAQNIGNLTVSRKVFVPDNDEFARWLNVITNAGTGLEHVILTTANNLGSDTGTFIYATSSGDMTADVTDLWVGTFQNYSTGTSPDVRLAHVLQGPSAPIAVNQISFTNGDDNPTWGYEFDLPAGKTFIFMNFCVGQPSKAEAAAKASELTGLPDNALQCLTSEELNSIQNFVTGDCDGDGVNDANQIAADLAQDANNNGVVDSCDILSGTSQDCDNNGVPDEAQPDTDGDGIIDACDNAPDDSNPDQMDTDGDGVGDVVDNAPDDPNPDQADTDSDGVPDVVDNAPDVSNPDQADSNGDGIGDVLDDNGNDNGGSGDMSTMCGACGSAGMSLMPILMAGYAGLLVSRRRR